MVLYEEPKLDIILLDAYIRTNDLTGASGGDVKDDENLEDWINSGNSV